MIIIETQEKYDFSVDWFAPNIPVWDMFLPQFNPKKILEIGAYEGRSTCYLIEKFGQIRQLEIHCVDSWEGGVEHDKSAMSSVEQRFDKNTRLAIKNALYPVSLVKHKKYSNIALAELIAGGHTSNFDVVYVDGSHQAPDVLSDAVMSFPLLRVGGLMIFDDYLWSVDEMGKQDPFKMPKPAIDAFLNLYQRKMQVVRGAPVYQLYATKVGP